MAKRIALQVESDGQSSMIFGDGNRVHQILWNLLSNAVKFTDAGGRVDARLMHIGDRIEISISDTGIGIEPEFLPHVFDRFWQADSSSKKRYSGLGLGLAIVRYLAEAHGGTVSAYSPGKGQGSTFKVTFPLAEPGSAQLGSGPSKPEYKALLDGRTAGMEKLHGLRVLVVDDDPETLDMLKFLLAQCEAEVTTATSVREALRVLEHSRINVLVSDLAMPDEGGYDLIRQVRKRAQEGGGNMPAIALSAYTRSEDRERALAAGFQLHLAKPIAAAELVSAMGNFRKAA